MAMALVFDWAVTVALAGSLRTRCMAREQTEALKGYNYDMHMRPGKSMWTVDMGREGIWAQVKEGKGKGQE
jgi:hypothetical protein